MAGTTGDYLSGPDDKIANMGTTRVTQMTTWPELGLQEWPRWLPGYDGTTRVP